MKDIFWILRWRQHKLGFERSTIDILGERYLTRWILHFGIFNLRLHKFYRGDDDRAMHDHPFWFVTFPLADYIEDTELWGQRLVKAWRLHFRGRDFKHRVMSSAKAIYYRWAFPDTGVEPLLAAVDYGPPFYTLVLAGPYSDGWGFYEETGEFTNWRDWK